MSTTESLTPFKSYREDIAQDLERIEGKLDVLLNMLEDLMKIAVER